MKEVLIGRVDDWSGRTYRVVEVDGAEVGVIHWDGRFYAYANYCVHQGGPACEGRILGKVVATFTPGGEYVEDRFSSMQIHFVCPWHGWEYLLETGEAAGDRTLRLKKYEVRQRGEDVYLTV